MAYIMLQYDRPTDVRNWHDYNDRVKGWIARLLEPFREVWIRDQGVAVRRRSMRRIMARRTNAAALRAWRS